MNLIEATIPMNDDEWAAFETIPNVLSATRMEPNEQGPIQVESKDGAIWVVSGKRVQRIK